MAYRDIMPYFDIYLYMFMVKIEVYCVPLKKMDTQNSTIANFGQPVFNPSNAEATFIQSTRTQIF